MLRASFALLIVAIAGSTAGAAIGPVDTSAIRTLDGTLVTPGASFNVRGTPINFNVYTGIATAAGNLVLLDLNPPARDDVVTLGTTNEQINDYIAAAGGVQRFVTSTYQTNVTPGIDIITITVSGRNANSEAADLWPAGFASGGNPLTSGAFGIGLNLGAALGGSVPLNLAPNNALQSASLQITTDGVVGPEITLPPALLTPNMWNWGGVLGVSLGGGATGTGVQSDITFRIVIPAPASAALLGMGGIVAFRRRRA